MAIRPELQPILDSLLAGERKEITLDQLAEELGPRAVSGGDVEALMDALEAAGVHVRSPDPVDLPAELAEVLGTARMMANELGRAPSPAAIAERAGLDPAVVRRALIYARVLLR